MSISLPLPEQQDPSPEAPLCQHLGEDPSPAETWSRRASACSTGTQPVRRLRKRQPLAQSFLQGREPWASRLARPRCCAFPERPTLPPHPHPHSRPGVSCDLLDGLAVNLVPEIHSFSWQSCGDRRGRRWGWDGVESEVRDPANGHGQGQVGVTATVLSQA